MPNIHNRRDLKTLGAVVLLLAGTATLVAVARKDDRDKRRADYFVPSSPEKVVWGGFPIDFPPVLTMESGQTVRIDALSQYGATGPISPTAVLAQFSVPPSQDRPDRE